MVFEREKTEKTNGDRELARTEKSLLYALSIRAATERNRNGYYPSGGSYPKPSAKWNVLCVPNPSVSKHDR